MGSLACEKVLGRVIRNLPSLDWGGGGAYCCYELGCRCLREHHCLHQMVLVGNELINLGVGLVVSITAMSVAVIPCVHHLRGFLER
jgi:hypothetical protein